MMPGGVGLGPGSANPPVITKQHTHCDRLFKIEHFQTRPLRFSNQASVVGNCTRAHRNRSAT